MSVFRPAVVEDCSCVSFVVAVVVATTSSLRPKGASVRVAAANLVRWWSAGRAFAERPLAVDYRTCR